MKVYRVGGAVRDELLGRGVADRDYVVVGATPEQMIAAGFRPVGRDFPVFLHPETHEEYALARTERKAGRGYRGFEFFAAPDVTLEQDLERRDLTINAMARDDDGALIDPFGGAQDLAAGILRHVSPAFAEDPLRVLRVARFAARFDFAVAPETEALMRALADSGELGLLSAERVWQEIARGLMEPRPSRMIAVLRACGALRQVLPEVDALFGVPQPPRHHPELDTGVHVCLALDHAAAHGFPLPARYAVLTHDLGKGETSADTWPRHHAHEARSVRLAAALSERLRVPTECRDAARLTARWHGVVHRAAELRPATLLELFTEADAFRRPERLEQLLLACEADARSRPGQGDYRASDLVRSAFAAVRSVDAGAVAREALARSARRIQADSARAEAKGSRNATDRAHRDDAASDSVARAVRAARIAALRTWKDQMR